MKTVQVLYEIKLDIEKKIKSYTDAGDSLVVCGLEEALHIINDYIDDIIF